MPDHRAILNPVAGEGRYTLARYQPSPWLAAFVEHHWIVRWNVVEPFEQETLPNPVVNVVVGMHQPGVWGPQTKRFVATLVDRGWVIGAKFLPGGFRPFCGCDLAELVDTDLPVSELFDRELARRVEMASKTDDGLVAAMETMLRAAVAETGSSDPSDPSDPNLEVAARAVELAKTDRDLAKAAELASRVGMSSRSLERLFKRYVGVSPKWVVRSFRVHEACERVKGGIAPDWSAFAHELGYFDQSHFIRDFKALVGKTPVEYVDACAMARDTATRESSTRDAAVSARSACVPGSPTATPDRGR